MHYAVYANEVLQTKKKKERRRATIWWKCWPQLHIIVILLIYMVYLKSLEAWLTTFLLSRVIDILGEEILARKYRIRMRYMLL